MAGPRGGGCQPIKAVDGNLRPMGAERSEEAINNANDLGRRSGPGGGTVL